MVLSDRFTGDPHASILKRTAIYVLGFGMGSLLIAVVVSFTLMSVAEGVLPADDASEVVEGEPVNVIGDDPAQKSSETGSKAQRARGNQGAAEDGPI